MASDDRPDSARPRFTTRTLLTPQEEPGDGAANASLEPSFGTGSTDDDAALDAIVEGARQDDDIAPESTFVWSAPPVPQPTPNLDQDDVFELASALDGEPTIRTGSTLAEEPEVDLKAETSAESEMGLDLEGESHVEAGAMFESEQTVTASAETPAVEDALEDQPAVAETPILESDSAHVLEVESLSSATEHVEVEDLAREEQSAVESAESEGGILPTLTTSATAVVGALADVIEPDAEAEASTVESAEASSDAALESEDAHAVELEANVEDDQLDAQPALEAEAPETDALETEAVTSDLDGAFESETDPLKADEPAGDVEGDLDVATLGPDDFEPEELVGVLRTMMTSRRLDQKMLTLLKQGKGFFHIGSAGHEASQTAVARQFEGGSDWFCCYYRDLATVLTVGVTPREVLQAHFGKASDPFGGGRQMPEHFGHRELNIMSTSSSVAAQYVPAVGFALAVKREDTEGQTRAVYASGGEGSTSQGAFHEALNWAAREALPVLFHIQDNKYAISVHVDEQTAGGSIWHLLGGYAGLKRIRYDGTDFFQSAAAAQAAMEHIRSGKGPVALHADLVRLLPHSSSDDHRKYREAASIEADAARDPIPQFSARLIEAGILTEQDVEAMQAEVAEEINLLARDVEAEADPDPSTATDYVYYQGEDARSYEEEGEAGDLVVMVDAINHALDEEMTRDERVLVYGEDVGGGKGGVFTATRGLTEKHGWDRCFNSPLAEHSVIGSAVGLACAGFKPVVEIQFADYIWPAMQQIRNQVASMRYRSNNEWVCPMVIRVPCGGYIHGGLCHSQNVEAMFGHFPGLHVVMPSNAGDAKGLLKAAIRGEDPVLFLEHKALYRQGPARRPEPHDEYLVPLGKAAVTREGTDMTIVTWGAIVYKALNVAKKLEKEGVSVEVIDVRSFMPFDAETVLESARKTGRVLVAYEDHEFMGFGAEIAAQISDAAFGNLDAPVKRVAGAFSSIPYADALEKAVLPQDADVLEAARELLAY